MIRLTPSMAPRHYVHITMRQRALIICLSMIGWPLNYNIWLMAGYFAPTLFGRIDNGQFEISR